MIKKKSEKMTMKECMKMHMDEGMSEEKAKAKCEISVKAVKAEDVKKIDEPVVETVESEAEAETEEAETVVETEEVEEKVEEAKEEVVETKEIVEEKPAEIVEEAPEVKAEEPIVPEVKQEPIKVEDIAKAIATEMSKAFQSVMDSIVDLKKEITSAKGAEVVAKDIAKVEEPKEEVVEKPAPKEEIQKVEEKPTESSGEVVAKLQGTINDLMNRITKLEAAPATSKVVSPMAVARQFAGGGNANEEIAKLDAELAELAKVRDTDLSRYQLERLGDKAFDLIKRRKALIS